MVSYANVGKLRFRTEDDQQLWHACSCLITNCSIVYNTLILSRLWAHKVSVGDTIGAALIPQISPVAWQHITVYGRYAFTKGPDLINLEAIVEALAQRPMVPVKEREEAYVRPNAPFLGDMQNPPRCS